MFSIFNKKDKGKNNIISLSVKGMHCTSCAMNIDGALEDTAGVISANTSYAKAVVTIEYDEHKVTIERLKQVIIDEGYLVIAKT